VDSTTLVNVDVEMGSRAVAALDDAGLAPNVALWGTLAEYGDGRLILASNHFDVASPLKAAGIVLPALRKGGIPAEQAPSLVILRMNDPFVVGLRRLFAKTKSVSGMRLGGQSLGGRFLEDGYVYRIS
jgi:hypothetical protein